jgi:PilZ domain
MNENDRSEDRRAHPRKKMIKRAKIVYQDGNCLLDCIVADLSQGGVRLKHTDIFSCPNTFELQMEGEPARRCEVVQKSAHEVRVKFLD